MGISLERSESLDRFCVRWYHDQAALEEIKTQSEKNLAVFEAVSKNGHSTYGGVKLIFALEFQLTFFFGFLFTRQQKDWS